MRIWQLTPIDLSDPRWKLWNPEPIFVRAKSETEARDLAVSKTREYMPARFGQPIPINPWGRRQMIGDPWPTTCEDVTEQAIEYSADGPAVVLHHGERF